MRVRLIQNVCYPDAAVTDAGTVLEVSDAKAADWVKRGIAVKEQPAPEPVAAPAVSTPQFSKGKR